MTVFVVLIQQVFRRVNVSQASRELLVNIHRDAQTHHVKMVLHALTNQQMVVLIIVNVLPISMVKIVSIK